VFFFVIAVASCFAYRLLLIIKFVKRAIDHCSLVQLEADTFLGLGAALAVTLWRERHHL
jgi:hypothetical protein